MDPFTGALAGKGVDSLFRLLGKLGQPNRAEKLVERMLSKRDDSLPRPKLAERRKLEQLLASNETWSLLIATSVTVSDELVNRVEGCLSDTHDPEHRRALAQDMAELALSELPAALDPEDRAVLASYQARHLSEQYEGLRELVQSLRDRETVPHTSGDIAEYRRQLSDALGRRRPRHQFTITYCDHESSQIPLAQMPVTAEQNRRIAVHAKAGSGKSAALVDLAHRLNASHKNLVVFVDLKQWTYDRRMAADDESGWPTVDHILEASIVPVHSSSINSMHSSLPGASREYWLIDGINELPSELSGRVLDTLVDYLRTVIRSSIVFTDRTPSRYTDPGWTLLQLNPLDRAIA